MIDQSSTLCLSALERFLEPNTTPGHDEVDNEEDGVKYHEPASSREGWFSPSPSSIVMLEAILNKKLIITCILIWSALSSIILLVLRDLLIFVVFHAG